MHVRALFVALALEFGYEGAAAAFYIGRRGGCA
jgi:hypothetical protein